MISLEDARGAVKRRAAHAMNSATRLLAPAAKRGAPRHNVHYQLGRAHEKAGDWPNAALAYQAAVNGDSTHPDWYFRLARAWAKVGDWPKAAAAYRSAIDGDPTHAEWHFQLGRAWERAGNPVGAIEAYQSALSRDPDHPDWFYRLGTAFLKIRNVPSAAYCFRQADTRFNDAGRPGQSPPSHRLPYERRIELSLIPKPAYAYCLYRGAQLAKRLGIDHVSALELGVAGGNGLLAMETHAADIEQLTGVRISVFGLDSGEGLYEPADLRDLPYYFAPGHYRMDVEGLRKRLQRAELILGDARQTFARFVEGGNPPVAAIAFDMDYYSSTSGVLEVVGQEAHEVAFLPRVYTYFDDITGRDLQDYNEFTGELLAIAEFNASRLTAKFAWNRQFLAKKFRPGWSEQIYTLHRFAHPDYGTYVGSDRPRSLHLRE